LRLNKEIKIGLLSIFSLTIFYIGLSFLKGNEIFSSKNIYYTIYNKSAGLNISNPILINGFCVGMVKNIKILQNRDYSILVTFEVDKNLLIKNSTIAKLISSDLLGSRAIELIIPEIGVPLKNYDTIVSDIEQSLKDVFIESTTPVIDDINITVRLINSFITNISKEKINMAFSNLEKATQKIKEIININKKNINIAGNNIANISNTFSDEKNGIKPLLNKLNKIGSKVEGIFNKKNKSRGTLKKIIHDESLYINFNKLLINLNEILVDLKKNPKRYINISLLKMR